MSARYEISEGELDVLAITGPEGTRYIDGEEIEARVIRQQSADIAELSAVVALLTHKVICCGVAASHPNAALTTTGAYADKWDSPQAESVRKLRAERDQLRAELAAAVAERSEYWGALHSTKDELFECRANQRTLESELRIMRDQRDTLRARLAELEKAAADPVAWMYDKGDEEGLVTPFNPLTTPGHGGRKNIRPLYAAPPAPVAEIREPTPEECERICTEYERLLMREGTCGGRDAFDAVRAVMWPKSEGL